MGLGFSIRLISQLPALLAFATQNPCDELSHNLNATFAKMASCIRTYQANLSKENTFKKLQIDPDLEDLDFDLRNASWRKIIYQNLLKADAPSFQSLEVIQAMIKRVIDNEIKAVPNDSIDVTSVVIEINTLIQIYNLLVDLLLELLAVDIKWLIYKCLIDSDIKPMLIDDIAINKFCLNFELQLANVKRLIDNDIKLLLRDDIVVNRLCQFIKLLQASIKRQIDNKIKMTQRSIIMAIDTLCQNFEEQLAFIIRSVVYDIKTELSDNVEINILLRFFEFIQTSVKLYIDNKIKTVLTKERLLAEIDALFFKQNVSKEVKFDIGRFLLNKRLITVKHLEELWAYMDKDYNFPLFEGFIECHGKEHKLEHIKGHEFIIHHYEELQKRHCLATLDNNNALKLTVKGKTLIFNEFDKKSLLTALQAKGYPTSHYNRSGYDSHRQEVSYLKSKDSRWKVSNEVHVIHLVRHKNSQHVMLVLEGLSFEEHFIEGYELVVFEGATSGKIIPCNQSDDQTYLKNKLKNKGQDYLSCSWLVKSTDLNILHKNLEQFLDKEITYDPLVVLG